MTETRKLSNILFADIAGYTSLMQGDENKAMHYLSNFKATLESTVPVHRGKIIQYFGDGCLLAFDSSAHSLECAIALQGAFKVFDLPVRIGIHLGEVVFTDENVFGDGVNIASRIESLGVPGAVLMSKAVRDQVVNKSAFTLVSLGSFDFKNVNESLEVFALTNDDLVVPRRNTMAGKLKTPPPRKKNYYKQAAIFLTILAAGFFFKSIFFSKENKDYPVKSLAILPFENTDNDSTLNFLTDGIPENLINNFSALKGVKVFARTATFGLSDAQRTIESLHQLLKADAILTGQLKKKGEGYYLNCELIDAKTQSLLWGNKYELHINDVSLVEDSILRSLQAPLNLQQIGTSNQYKRKPDPAAYAEYLKGRYLTYGSTSEESERALSHFREAIRIDPKYAQAYAAIANEKVVQILFSTATKQEVVNEARTAIEAAKALDPNISEIYSAEGSLKFYYDWDWEGAEASYKKALELDPGNAINYIRYSAALGALGKYKESLELADKAVELDPVSRSSLHNLGWTNLIAGNYEKSVQAFAKALELHPNWVWGHVKKGYGHVFLGECEEAIALTERAQELLSDDWGSELLQCTFAFTYTRCNKPKDAARIIDRFLAYARENTIEDPFNLALMYYSTGDYKNTIAWEEKTVEGRYPSAYLMNIPLFYSDEFFNGPEHQALLRKMGLGK
jgi:adenylate cyclase